MPEVAITEEFTSSNGQFQNYTASDSVVLQDILQQSHVDIRCLTSDVTVSSVVYFPGEHWVGGTLSSGTHNIPILSITCPASTTTICSSTTPYSSAPWYSNISTSVNLQGMKDTDHLSVALPSFPLSDIDTTHSFFDLTSDPGGVFTNHTAALRFDRARISLIAGNSELRFLRSDITDPANAVGANPINIGSITGVRFRIAATSNCTVKVAAIRLLSSNWQSGGFDIDTKYKRFRTCVNRKGEATTDFAWPTLLRAGNPVGTDDPHLADCGFTVAFHTGTLTGDTEGVTLFFRERFELPNEIQDLQGESMENLDQGNPSTYFDLRTMQSLDSQAQSNLDKDTMSQLEHFGDPHPVLARETWTQVALTWNSTTTTLTAENAQDLSTPYSWTPPTLTAHSDYLLKVSLNGNTFRGQLYTLDIQADVQTPAIFDTTPITDSFKFKRGIGRVGWFPDLVNGDAYIQSVRTTSMTFGEYQSLPMSSVTPVEGVELYASGAGDEPLVIGVDPIGPVTVSDDLFKVSGARAGIPVTGSFKFFATGDGAGFISNPFLITDLENTYIDFDLFVPQATINQGSAFVLYLVSYLGNELSLPLPAITSEQWQHVNFASLPFLPQQTGTYRLVMQTTGSGNYPYYWWIDNFNINGRRIAWSARTDPSQSWMPLRSVINTNDSGVCLQRGTELQVRGQSLHQDAFIAELAFKPKYSQLGRLVWPEQALTPTTPAPHFTHTTSGSNHTFNGTTSTSTVPIASWVWTFTADGSYATGPIVSKTYSGTQTVYLTVTDAQGIKASTSAVV